MVENTKGTTQELQNLQQQYKGQEMELHKLMASAKYQSLTYVSGERLWWFGGFASGGIL